MASWQSSLVEHLRGALAGVGTVEPYGSTLSPAQIDGWSDLDVALTLTEPIEYQRLKLGPLWAWQEVSDCEAQVLRMVLVDGRRVDARVSDARVTGGLLRLPEPPADNAVRFDAALAATRMGRGDYLIGYHLTLGILKECLVQAMQIRDGQVGTDRHRFGTGIDDRATEVARVAALPFKTDQRPQIIEDACRLYGAWRAELEPDYRPDWTGLEAVLERGFA